MSCSRASSAASSSSAGRNSNQRTEGHKREREHDQGDNDDDDEDTEIQHQQKKQHRSERNGKFELSEKDRTLQLAYGSDLIRESGMSLRLAHSSISFAQHLMHRFYKAHSLLDECMIWVCGASLLLSVKCHHHHKHFNDTRTIHHISASLYNRLHDREQSTEVLLNFYGSQGYEWRTAIIATERRILIAIGFHLFNDLRPHHFLVFFIDKLQQHSVATSWTSSPPSPIFQRLLQCAWNFTNDCFLSDLCVFHPPEAVACACIVVALEKCQLRLPQGWQIVFGSSTDECQRISELIKQVYQLGPLRGAYVDYSRTDAFSQFHPKTIIK